MKRSFGINALTVTLFDLNALVDKGIHVKVSYDEMNRWMEAKTVVPSLLSLYPNAFHLLACAGELAPGFTKYYHNALCTFQNVIDSRRKMGVDQNGITLLIAYTLEIMQQGEGWIPPNNIAGIDD